MNRRQLIPQAARGYNVTALSGLVTGQAADAQLFGLRATSTIWITGARLSWRSITGATVAGELSCRLRKASTFSAIHDTGGTVVVPSPALQQDASNAESFISTTGAITGATVTPGATIAVDSFAERLADDAVHLGMLEAGALIPEALVLQADEGLVVDLAVAMPTSLAGRLLVELSYYELV